MIYEFGATLLEVQIANSILETFPFPKTTLNNFLALTEVCFNSYAVPH